MILQPLKDFIVPINGDQVITRFCKVGALQLFWRVNGVTVHSETLDEFKAIGFTFRSQAQVINETVMDFVKINISSEYMNNNTVLLCIAHIEGEQNLNSSATLIIAGK